MKKKNWKYQQKPWKPTAMSDEPKQLKLTPVPEGEFKPKKGKKENEEKANKWVVVAILVVTVLVSLVFYFSGSGRPGKKEEKTWPQKSGLFGPKIYEF